jgi:DnaJ-class molecular chaperone
MPLSKSTSNEHGNLIVKVEVVFPTNLSVDEKKLLWGILGNK